jgi:hypothetical protein
MPRHPGEIEGIFVLYLHLSAELGLIGPEGYTVFQARQMVGQSGAPAAGTDDSQRKGRRR